MSIKFRLIIMNFLQFGVWGAYLTSMGSYLASVGLGARIGIFYAMQGIVSIFMPTLMGIVADKFIPAQKLLGICHGISGVAMTAAAFYGMTAGTDVAFAPLFAMYTLSVAFYMPTLALSNSVSYTVLTKSGLDTVKAFPPIRVFGTVGFIVSMLLVDFTGFQNNYNQFFASAVWGLVLALYSVTLPNCAVDRSAEKKSLAAAFGLDAFKLFGQKRMAMFFVFSMLLGAALQVSNGYANTFIGDFGKFDEYAGTFAVEHTNMLISLSQLSETLCILLIPFFLKRFGIKTVMLIAMFGWMFRFGFFAVGDPGMPGVLMFVMSMVVYGVAFDFFNISGSLFVDQEVPENQRSSAQGLFMLMTNGLGASIGVIAAQEVVNHFTANQTNFAGWSTAWYIFAGYALVIAVLFAIFFKDKKAA